MSKVICEICGTSYPDTADQCPICGNVRSAGDVMSDNSQEASAAQESGYTYVKGGRFSKSNVKKRNKASRRGGGEVPSGRPPKAPREPEDDLPEEEPRHASNKGLWITAVILLIAVIAVAAFIVFHFFLPNFEFGKETEPAVTLQPTTEPVVTTVPATTVPETTVPETTLPAVIPCTGVKLMDTEISLDAAGRAWLLEASAEPASTTDQITFRSENENIATVTEQGRIEAVGGGETFIVVTCGSQTARCKVVCDFEGGPEATTEATEDSGSTEATTEPTEETQKKPDDLVISHTDVTLFKKGESFEITAEGLHSYDISWSVNNSAVADVSNGTVTAVGPGMTTVFAEYNGQTASCIIRCEFTVPTEETEAPAETTKPAETEPAETTKPAETKPAETTKPAEETKPEVPSESIEVLG